MSTILVSAEQGPPQDDVPGRLEACPTGELKPVESSPVVNEISTPDEAATPLAAALCEEAMNTPEASARSLQNVNKTVLGAGLPTPPTGLTEGLPAAGRGDLRSDVSAGSETRAEPGQPLNSSEASASELENVNKIESGVGFQPAQNPDPGRLEACPTPSEPEEKQYRWDDKHRQEALDYHCMIHGIPPLELQQVVGLPDPKHISPKMAIQRGYPYILHCDRSIPSKRPPVRDTRKVITVW